MLLKIAFSFLKPTPLYDETRATPHSPRFRKAFYASVRRATLLTLPSHQRQAYPLADRTILHGYYTTLVSFVNICGAWSAVWLCADANVRSNCKAFRAHNSMISGAGTTPDRRPTGDRTTTDRGQDDSPTPTAPRGCLSYLWYSITILIV